MSELRDPHKPRLSFDRTYRPSFSRLSRTALTSVTAQSGKIVATSLVGELFPPLHVRDSFFVALDYNFGAFFDGNAVFAASARASANTAEREDDFAGALLADREA